MPHVYSAGLTGTENGADMTSYVRLRLNLSREAYAKVTFYDDGSAVLYLYAVMAARKDVTGEIHLGPQGDVISNDVQDSYGSNALTPYVVGVVERRARTYLAQARTHLRRIAAAHHAVKENT